MNTLKTIYKKLSDKTELAKHEVKLGLAQDMSKSYDLVLSSILSLSDQLDTILKAENRAGEIRSGLVKQYSQFY